LGIVGYGLFSYAMAWVLLFALAQLGLAQLALRETARSLEVGDFAALRGIWSWSAAVLGGYGLSVLTIAWAIAAFGDGVEARMMAAALWIVPLLGLCYLAGAVLRALGRLAWGQMVESSLTPSLFVLLVLMFELVTGMSLSPERALGLYAAGALLAAAGGLWTWWRELPAPVRRTGGRWQAAAWGWSLAALAASALLSSASLQVNAVLLGFFRSPEEVGLFRVAAQIAMLAVFGLTAANTALAPSFAAAHARGDRRALQQLASLSATVSALIAGTIALLSALFGRPLLAAAFGPQFAAAYGPLMILLLAQLVNAATGSVGFLLAMCRREHDALAAQAAGVTVNLALAAFLIPPFGIGGAAVAAAVATVTWNVWMFVVLKARLDILSLPFAARR